jgi:uncharacterized protein with GYD domain
VYLQRYKLHGGLNTRRFENRNQKEEDIMPTYVLLSSFSSDAIIEPEEMASLNSTVKKRVKKECADVVWKDSYVLLGRYDSLDIFTAPDNETASKVAMVIRSFGHATTEILPATQWEAFQSLLDATGKSSEGAGRHDEQLEDGGLGGRMEDAEDAQKAIKDKVDEAMVESFPASDPPGYSS